MSPGLSPQAVSPSPLRRRAGRPAAPLWLLALALTSAGVLAATPRTAEACSPALPRIDVLRPADGETGVPTNTKIWVGNSAFVVVKLQVGAKTIGSDVVQPLPNGYVRAATPLVALDPNTEYTVTASSTAEIPPVTWRFTTGAGPATGALPAPSRLTVTAERVKEEQRGCVGPRDGYQVRIDAEPVQGAALYELAVEENGQFLTSEISTTPLMGRFLTELPSPRYRVRPISLSGVGAVESELPSERVTEADNEGGCSAAGTGSSAALWLIAGVLGLGLVARRRRAAAR